jgi:hypothetical protein
MTHHETGTRWAAAVRIARRLGRAASRKLDGRSGPHWAVAPYPLSGSVPGYPIARDAARWRH